MQKSKMYDIKHAAQYLGIAPSTLRYWEHEGLVRSARNLNNDYRQYSVHDLIDASEIAFYRKLGVSVKDLQSYRVLSASALDEALKRTQHDVEKSIAELETMHERLTRQRALNTYAKDLQKYSMRPGIPSIKRLSVIDYDDRRLWHLLVNEPWRYGVVIEFSAPEVVRETVVDALSSDTETIWEKDAYNNYSSTLECLLLVQPNGNATNAQKLFEEAQLRGVSPSCIVGSYLLTASQDNDSARWDFYRAWIIS